jgi:hypothetical protein
MTPSTWLWQEIERRCGAEIAAELHEGYLARMRAYNRVRRNSATPPDAPRQKPGRKPWKHAKN